MGKRLFDFVIAALGLVFVSPLLMVAAVAIKVTSAGPVVYRGKRVGLGGIPFKIYKLRTMTTVENAEVARVTRSADPRITLLGRWLRRFKLDELPQLANVVRGEMSLVGPRPEDPELVALYSERQRRVLTVRPGITGLASIRYRNEETLLVGEDWGKTYVSEIMPAKLELDLEYIDRQSFGLDLKILLETLRSVWEKMV